MFSWCSSWGLITDGYLNSSIQASFLKQFFGVDSSSFCIAVRISCITIFVWRIDITSGLCKCSDNKDAYDGLNTFIFLQLSYFRKASYVFWWDVSLDSVQTPSSGKLYIDFLPNSHPSCLLMWYFNVIFFFLQIMSPAAGASSSRPQVDFLGELGRQMRSANPRFSTWQMTWIIQWSSRLNLDLLNSLRTLWC